MLFTNIGYVILFRHEVSIFKSQKKVWKWLLRVETPPTLRKLTRFHARNSLTTSVKMKPWKFERTLLCWKFKILNRFFFFWIGSLSIGFWCDLMSKVSKDKENVFWCDHSQRGCSPNKPHRPTLTPRIQPKL